jgi:two-component system OmpR family sensor kinase/two-component system sensor histidine kinase BaeS
MRKHRQYYAPPWWPEGEAWPPDRSANSRFWGGMRKQLFRRFIGFVITIAILMTVSLVVLFFIVSHLTDFLKLPPPILMIARPVGFLFGFFLFLLIARLLWNFRRSALPFGDFLEGVGHVADGDYSVRFQETGPVEIRSLARAFNRMTEKLQKNDEQRCRLLADVTHELRTPMTIIQGNLEGIIDGIYPADNDHIQIVLEETKVLSHIIDDLRTLSLAESGALKLQKELVSIPSLISEVLKSYEAATSKAGIRLVVQADRNLPEVEIDPMRIRQVLENLISNALRYTPDPGEIIIRAWSSPLEDPFLRIAVKDSGKGISPQDLDHIFDRFYKSVDSRGTGLGLAIVKSLVVAHGGTIQVESLPEGGTNIWFTIPLQSDLNNTA